MLEKDLVRILAILTFMALYMNKVKAKFNY